MTEFPTPAAPDIERLTLGALMNDPDGIDLAIGNLAPDDFTEERHKRIFLRIRDLRQRGAEVDRVTLYHALDRERQAESIGGLSYLVSLDEGMPQIANISGWIGLLREKSNARRIISLTNDVQSRARAGEDSNTLVDALRSIGERVALKDAQSFETAAEILERTGHDEFFTPKHNLGIEPPIPWLAERFRFVPKSQTILAAITGGGKTALAGQCVLEAAKRNYRTCWYSLEMENEENLRRLVGQEAHVNMHRLRMGAGTFQERQDAAYALGKIAELEDLILFRDTPIDVQAINADLQRLKMDGRPAQFVVVDHLLLMQTSGRTENRAQEVSALSRGLKNTWTRFGIPVLVLTQFSRKGDENDEPELGWLKESGSIEQDASHVIFLWARSDKDRDSDVREWRGKLAKNRNGPVGRFDLSFTRKYVRFDQVGG